ncbi:hypothetical protein BDP27DRAFT_1027563 [Rhodocollybia butyracea]|uniref:Uncharacterized protein n=1 Tax=Rhodocollybia butyracea TaxID=206335 RepID=A0A9P5TUQ3_9AGAR|nr:hypothetical protein BDP27DRAFT_1027563 [Rhodocollybia butyracea]
MQQLLHANDLAAGSLPMQRDLNDMNRTEEGVRRRGQLVRDSLHFNTGSFCMLLPQLQCRYLYLEVEVVCLKPGCSRKHYAESDMKLPETMTRDIFMRAVAVATVSSLSHQNTQ